MNRFSWVAWFTLSMALSATVFYIFKGASSSERAFGRMRWQMASSSSQNFGAHRVSVDVKDQRIFVEKSGKEIWSTVAGKAFLGSSLGTIHMRENFGSFKITYRNLERCTDFFVQSISTEESRVRLHGLLECKGESFDWDIYFSENKYGDLDVHMQVDEKLNRVFWRLKSNAGEHIFGGGEQYTFLDLKGHDLPLWVSEQGIGRGLQPLTMLMNLIAGSGGDRFTTYMSSGLIVTTDNRAMFRHGARYGELDFRNSDEMIFDYWDHQVDISVSTADSPKELLTKTSEYTGRMRALPDWMHKGAILGLQGGTDKVTRILKDFENLKTPIAGVWLQDWVGQRKTAIGYQLWWNWELNKEHYPRWNEFKGELNRRNIRLLGYVNPFLVELPGDVPHSRNLFDEARGLGLLLKDDKGEVMKFKITSFDAAMLDLSNATTRKWIGSVIQTELIDQGFRGWMADFGEALPTDVRLAGGDANSFHNRYTEAWAEVNREVVDRQPESSDFVFFTRSGFSESPKFSTLFWAGDQLVSWDEYDGLKSALTGLLSSGLSGVSLNHSDIGGYTAISVPGLSYLRSEELLMRWMEFSAFTAVFRTHEGTRPQENAQVYSNDRMMKSFSENAQIFSSMFEYRKRLMREASEKGWPVVRTMWFEFPEEKVLWENQRQFMLGDEILVAPVLEPAARAVRVYLPKGRWRQLFTEKEFNIETSHWVSVDAPLGQPAAFQKMQ